MVEQSNVVDVARRESIWRANVAGSSSVYAMIVLCHIFACLVRCPDVVFVAAKE